MRVMPSPTRGEGAATTAAVQMDRLGATRGSTAADRTRWPDRPNNAQSLCPYRAIRIRSHQRLRIRKGPKFRETQYEWEGGPERRLSGFEFLTPQSSAMNFDFSDDQKQLRD